MNPLTAEWVDKAEEDYDVARLARRARKYNAACFHAQQCAEKYMKAVLHESGLPFERTHQLSELLDSLTRVNPMSETLREATEALADYAVRPRYPGLTADAVMARTAVGACEFIRARLRQHLALRQAIRKDPRKKQGGR